MRRLHIIVTKGEFIMQKIKDFLFTSLGSFGCLAYYVMWLVLAVYPLLMFSMPWWLYLTLGFVAQFILIKIPFGFEALWIAGLFGAISSEQDIFAYIYYVLFALVILYAIMRIVRILRLVKRK